PRRGPHPGGPAVGRRRGAKGKGKGKEGDRVCQAGGPEMSPETTLEVRTRFRFPNREQGTGNGNGEPAFDRDDSTQATPVDEGMETGRGSVARRDLMARSCFSISLSVLSRRSIGTAPRLDPPQRSRRSPHSRFPFPVPCSLFRIPSRIRFQIPL